MGEGRGNRLYKTKGKTNRKENFQVREEVEEEDKKRFGPIYSYTW